MMELGYMVGTVVATPLNGIFFLVNIVVNGVWKK